MMNNIFGRIQFFFFSIIRSKPRQLNQYDIESMLESALIYFIRRDHFLLDTDVNERTISARLGHYLTWEFRDFDVDCEYNRNIDAENGKKYIMMLRNELLEYKPNLRNQNALIQSLVYPDIIVHRRGRNDWNTLIIEMKKTTNTDDRDRAFDDKKLRIFTSPHNDNHFHYRYGVFIDLGIVEQIPTCQLTWYKGGQILKIHNIN